ncbi:aromatic hydrocarbon degradation protein [Opitutaceae bacterium EW11]|nr:aromatic hydrocarbon degradation protein [Opitutaceae bacterium EW11]
MKLPRFEAAVRHAAATLALLALSHQLRATNGMNMEGYGPVATALGGASMAYDNGTAGVINNPATLSLMPSADRLDLALGVLGPQITAAAPNGASAKSQSTTFFMPAFGYARKAGNIVYGLGVFGQGGMGCEYDKDTWRGLGFGLENRTEVSVGRVILPVSYRVNDQLSVAATLDYVWAGMDLKMAMSGAQFTDLLSTHQIGQASGSIVQSFGQIMASMPAGTSVDYAYFDFSNSSDFTGEASGKGYAGKVGIVYTPQPGLAFGLTYHSKTRLDDLEAPGNSIRFQMNVPGMGRVPQTLAGDITVRDFEWPAMLGGGVAWQPNDRWLLVADIRRVFWADVMKNFNLAFVASSATANGPFAGQRLDAQLYQNWDDQTVIQVGAAYRLSGNLTVRAGFNHGNDPIPDRYLNCLFPATVETHLTIGCGYALGEHGSIEFSYTHGFEHSVTNGGGVRVSHSQNNAQLMYALRF